MVSKNNRMKKMEKSADRKPHFAIRKLTIGAASVLLGTTLWMSTTASTSHADTVNDNNNNSPTSGEESNTETSSNAGNADSDKAVVIANNDAAKNASTTSKQENITVNDDKAEAQAPKADTTVSIDKSNVAEQKVDTSSLETKSAPATTVKSNDTNQAASTTNKQAANQTQTNINNENKTANTAAKKSADNSLTSAAEKLAKDATANTAQITKSTKDADAAETTVTDAGQVGKQDSVETQNFDISGALGKLTDAKLNHSALDDLTDVNLKDILGNQDSEKVDTKSRSALSEAELKAARLYGANFTQITSTDSGLKPGVDFPWPNKGKNNNLTPEQLEAVKKASLAESQQKIDQRQQQMDQDEATLKEKTKVTEDKAAQNNRDVSSWTDLENALKDSSIDQITVNGSLNANPLYIGGTPNSRASNTFSETSKD